MDSVKAVTIIGAGSWGTSIAKCMAETYPDITVTMWAYEKKVTQEINKNNQNNTYLPGIQLPGNINASSELKEVCRDADVIILSPPSKVLADITNRISKYITEKTHVAFLSKGFCKYNDEILTISQTIAKIIPELHDRVVAVYGPSHAEEVSRKYHTCLNIAARMPESRHIIAKLLTSDYVQCRETDDILGVEVGGTLKNPAAIAAGMISVLPGCGDNLSGALISEALKEMLKLSKLFDARDETIIDISGSGDLVATALSEHSRNRRFGKDIATQIMNKGKSLGFTDKLFLRFKPEYIIEKMSEKLHYLAEGAYAIEPIIELATEHNIAIPVYRSLYEVLLNKKNPSLLIETIKNPEKFEELYSSTKIQIKSKSRGLENVKGAAFRDQIIKQTVKDMLFISAGKGADTEQQQKCIDELNDYYSENKNNNISMNHREVRVLKSLTSQNYKTSIKKLSQLYTDSIVDTFSPIFKKLFLLFVRLYYNRFIKTHPNSILKVSGSIHEIKSVKNSANLIFVSTYKSLYDFLTVCLSINKAGLPFPRFFVNKRAIKSKLQRFLIKRAGGFIIDPVKSSNKVYRKVLTKYLSILIEHGVPLLYFPEMEPEKNNTEEDTVDDFFNIISEALFKHTVEIVLVPVELAYKQFDQPSTDSDDSNNFYREADVNFSKPVFMSDYTRDAASIKALSETVKSMWIKDADYMESDSSRIRSIN